MTVFGFEPVDRCGTEHGGDLIENAVVMEDNLPDQNDRRDRNHQRCDKHRAETAFAGNIAHQNDSQQKRQNYGKRNGNGREGQRIFDCHAESTVGNQIFIVGEEYEILGNRIVKNRVIDDNQKWDEIIDLCKKSVEIVKEARG